MKNLKSIIFSFYSLVLSLIILPKYIEDDQKLYRLFYDSLGESDYLSGYALYENIIGSSEPIYYTLVFFLHSLISKDLLFSLINAIFAYILAKFICKYNKDWLLLFLSTNFYLMALFFSHERLKLAFTIFIILFISNTSSKYLKYSLVILTHFQMIIIVLINFLSKSKVQRIIKSNYIYKFIGIVLLMSIAFIFSGPILSKIYSYTESDINIYERISDVLKLAIFTFIGTKFCNKNSTAIIPNLILLPFIIILGGGRLIIFSYCFMMYFYITNKENKNILFSRLILIINLYFFYTGIIFLYKVYSKGYGF
jgi:hypothetical protein